MHVGCQTYSWEMQLDQRPTTLWEMFDAIAGAGFEGIEFTNNTAGPWLTQPERVKAELAARKLTLVAVAISRTGWTDPSGINDDLKLVATAAAFLANFPGAILALGGAAHTDTTNWKPALDQAIKFYTAAALTALSTGIRACVHPHSHHGSLIQTKEQYDHLFQHLPPSVGWCPDTGHIVRGGLSLLPTLQRYADRIGYVHMKDADAAGQWQPMGQGMIDFPAMFAWLQNRRFHGWLVAEEESQLAWQDPAAANRANFAYLQSKLPRD